MATGSIFVCRSRTSTPSPVPQWCWPRWWLGSGIWMRRGGATSPTTSWSRPSSWSSRPGLHWLRSRRVQSRVMRRAHPRRPRRPRRTVGRRPQPQAGHAGDLGRAGDPRPALRVPRLRPATPDVSRPPHHPLDIRRPDQAREPRPPVWPPPSPGDPPLTLGSPHQPPRPKTRIQTTTQTRRGKTLDQIPTTSGWRVIRPGLLRQLSVEHGRRAVAERRDDSARELQAGVRRVA